MIALMQPYFFPKLSYWQLIHKVDTFVINDDVQYIKGGWINKNRIIFKNSIKTISIPIKKDKFQKNINERYLATNWAQHKRKILSAIREYYRKSVNFIVIYPIIEKILNFNSMNLSNFVTNSIKEIVNYLEINTKIINSSSLNIGSEFKKDKKIKEICKILNSKIYINAIGGKKIYDKDDFKNSNIELNFLYPTNLLDNKNSASFDLSIIDTLMNIEKKLIQKELNEFKLI